jgi:hypothetical protein
MKKDVEKMMKRNKIDYIEFIGGTAEMFRQYLDFVSALEGKTLTAPVPSYAEYVNSRYEDYRFSYGCHC